MKVYECTLRYKAYVYGLDEEDAKKNVEEYIETEWDEPILNIEGPEITCREGREVKQ